MNREQIFRQLYADKIARDEYADSLPSDVCMAIIDNAYVNSIAAVNEQMIEFIFGDQAPSIFWFLYEWKPGYEVGIGDRTWSINSIDAYVQWMREFGGLEYD